MGCPAGCDSLFQAGLKMGICKVGIMADMGLSRNHDRQYKKFESAVSSKNDTS